MAINPDDPKLIPFYRKMVELNLPLQALLLLHNDIDRVRRELDKSLPWWRNLSDVRQKVLISMAFNLGMGRLLQFNRMLSALQDGDYTAAAEEMLSSVWANQVGTRAIELADMMENG